MTLSKILFPVDFSDRARQAAVYARVLASCFHSQITALHVLPVPRYEFGTATLGDLFPYRVKFAQQELSEFTSRTLDGTHHGLLVQSGDAAGLIVDYARKARVDLIVMPTHGRGPFRELLLGSTTAKVLHDAECPVLTGVHMESPADPREQGFQNIVCAVDLGPQSARIVKWAAGLAQAFGARLFLVHALPTPGVRDYQVLHGEWATEQARSAHSELELIGTQEKAGAVAIVTAGVPAPAVIWQVRELSGDLLVIGRGATGGLFGRLRSNAYDLIRESPCPVVSV